MKPMSIDEAARRLRAEWAESDDWDKLEEDTRNVWRDIARLAHKLFAQPAAKREDKLMCVCVHWDVLDQMRKHAAKAAAKKARKR